VIGRKSQGVTEDPKSLEGKTLGAPPPDAAFGQWPAFVEVATGLDTSGITIENVGFPVREPMLAQGQVDAIFGFSFSSVINLKAQGVPDDDISLILMGENGLDLYGNVVIANTDFAAENPDAVKGFVKALIKGYLDAIADPAAAIPYVMKRNEVLDEAVEIERLTMAVEGSIATPAVKENGFGGVDMDKLAKSMEYLKTSMGVSDTPPAPEQGVRPQLPAAQGRADGQVKPIGPVPSGRLLPWPQPATPEPPSASLFGRIDVTGFVELRDVRLTYGAAGRWHACARRTHDEREKGRIRRRGRPVRLRQVDPDEAGHRPHHAAGRHGRSRRARSGRTGVDRRDGLSEPVHAALADDAVQRHAAA
jgi:hypothetical protein